MNVAMPKFRPLSWVVGADSMGKFYMGQILSARYDGSGWIYSVSSAFEEENASIPEDNIVRQLKASKFRVETEKA